MKNRTVKAMMGVLATVLLVGCNSMTAGEQQTDTTDNSTVTDSYIDMDTVTGYSGTMTGLQLYFEDGNGYYLETENKQDGVTLVYYIQTDDDMDRLKEVLENRNGKIIIEVSNGTVTDSNGDGVDVCGYYRHYDNRFSVGDVVQSVFVYNPQNNSVDDILYRVDTLIEQ